LGCFKTKIFYWRNIKMVKKSLATIIVVSAAFLLISGCGGKDPQNEVVENTAYDRTDYPILDSYLAHYDNMIKILSDNKNEIDKAINELEQYQEKYNQEMQKLEEEITTSGSADPRLIAASVQALSRRYEQLNSLRDELVKRTLQ